MPPDHSISRQLRAHAYQLFVRSRWLFPSAYEILSITDTPMHWLSEQCALFTVICSSFVTSDGGTRVAVLVSQVGVAEFQTPQHDCHTEYHCDGEGVDVHVQNGASRL